MNSGFLLSVQSTSDQPDIPHPAPKLKNSSKRLIAAVNIYT
jgi:hypothetical protein